MSDYENTLELAAAVRAAPDRLKAQFAADVSRSCKDPERFALTFIVSQVWGRKPGG
jgi:hypothetical protein